MPFLFPFPFSPLPFLPSLLAASGVSAVPGVRGASVCSSRALWGLGLAWDSSNSSGQAHACSLSAPCQGCSSPAKGSRYGEWEHAYLLLLQSPVHPPCNPGWRGTGTPLWDSTDPTSGRQAEKGRGEEGVYPWAPEEKEERKFLPSSGLKSPATAPTVQCAHLTGGGEEAGCVQGVQPLVTAVTPTFVKSWIHFWSQVSRNMFFQSKCYVG